MKPQPCRNRSVNGAYETAARRGTTPAALRREAEGEELKREGMRVETGVYMKIENKSVRGFTIS